ncbi:Putative Flp pilus-assembly TadE/G-like [Nocardioides exalbidus]|uniref:Putative Flp pilus-assembly TadE/G-like n=1 Tax=Nocardioides exalbidus TaxID=402596 RepID=A0A1H4SGG6_9ACTN|nr:pilus assembly protein TadG-related protein [Nocardioides exalbidus]SEC43188.1 Putative Flp pilus-assembly TadE/G-like [Nocardioides exalbidus]
MKLFRIPSKRRRDEAGAVAILIAMFFAFIALPVGALAVDMSRIYVELQRLQAAADAAATAGVTYMPDDFDSAKARALAIAEDNGFPNSGTSSVSVVMGDKPTQLKVTVSSTVSNAFAKGIGVPNSTVSRYAVADFNGPAPMGSPCNSFANEPAGSAQQGPSTSQTKVPTYATCTNPQFWGAIAGPETWKDQGSQYDARKCGGTEDGCASRAGGAANNEFEPRGFVYLVRVAASGVGQSVRLQIYDPAYVETASDCTIGPVAITSNHYYSSSDISSGDNDKYPLATTDANLRYDNENNAFCTGDSDNDGRRFGSEVPTITSFALRSPVDNLNPYSAPALNPAQCTKQWPGYSNTSSYVNHNNGNGNHYDWTAGPRERNLRNSGSNNDYKQDVARVFHQWVDLCTFTPTKAGDYYLQVRSNVALPASYTLDSTGAVAGNSNVVNQEGDDTSVLGNGTNNFALRAVTGAAAGAITVAPFEKMRIYANADSANTTFNLVRVAPAAANKTLVVTYFDVGEATSSGSSSGSVQFIPPGDAKLGSVAMTSAANCVAAGPTTGNLSNCKVNGITSTTNNGKLQTVRIPIPNNYTCQVTTQGGCWWRVAVSFPGAEVHDATTWTARIVGEPVRLIE